MDEIKRSPVKNESRRWTWADKVEDLLSRTFAVVGMIAIVGLIFLWVVSLNNTTKDNQPAATVTMPDMNAELVAPVTETPTAEVVAPTPKVKPPAKIPVTAVEKPTLTITQRSILVSNLSIYGWESTKVAAILAAYDAGKFNTIKVMNGKWLDDLWGSPYERRWSEANMIAHLRDEHPAGANVIVITTETRRYTVLFDGCGGIEKIAVGEKPVVKVSSPRVVKTTPRKPKPIALNTDPYRVVCGTC